MAWTKEVVMGMEQSLRLRFPEIGICVQVDFSENASRRIQQGDGGRQ